MPPRSSSGHGWPNDSEMDSSPPEKGHRSKKGPGVSNSKHGNNDGSSSSLHKENGSKKGPSSNNSKSGNGKRHTPPAIDVPTPGQEGGQISPDEISGQRPEVPKKSEIAQVLMATTLYDYDDPSVRPMGFMNGKAPIRPTSICYRNAAITVLLNLPYFTNWLAGGYSPEGAEGSPTTIIDAMQRLAAKYWPDQNRMEDAMESGEATRPKQEQLDIEMDVLWNRFIAAKPNFTPKPKKKNSYCQEDAAIFLSELLDAALMELDSTSTNEEILGSMFRPWIAGSSYCSDRCQKKRKRMERDGYALLNEQAWIHIVNFQSPLLKQKGEKSFEECFDASLKQEQESHCPRCGRQTRRTVNERFLELPPILLTQLNRSTHKQEKIQDHCKIPREFTVPLDDSVRSKYENKKYRLAAVVAHQGDMSKSGHYISYVRNPAKEGSWIELNDQKVRNIGFNEINHNTKSGLKNMLPYVMAWELVDGSVDIAGEGDEGEAAKGAEEEKREQQLDEREKALDAREMGLDEREKTVENDRQKLVKTGVAQLDRGKELDERETALKKHEQDLKQRERNLQNEKVDDLFDNEKNDAPPAAPAGEQTDQIAQEVDEGKDTATFCATFRNTDNHDENARAIFKLNNFNPKAPTRIESTVQLSDLEGNLRSIKKGTAVTDGFAINFNVKGGTKRKRGNDGDEAGPPPPPPVKKTKKLAKQLEKPQSPPRVKENPLTPSEAKKESQVQKETQSSPKDEGEPQPPKTTKTPPPSPLIRRSTRNNKGKRSNLA